jgi:phage-related protein
LIQLPSQLQEPSQNPYAADSLVWLWALVVELNEAPTPSTIIRVTASDEPVEITGDTFYPYPIAQSEIQQTSEGDLPSVTLGFDNSGRWLMPYLDQYEGFIGRPATSYLVNAAAPSYTSAWSLDWTISSAEATAETVTFRLEIPNPYRRRVPVDRYNPQLCRWAFGSPGCGYPINEAAAFTSCRKTLADCIARGEDEASRRIPVRHPRRFGGFRGVPTERSP